MHGSGTQNSSEERIVARSNDSYIPLQERPTEQIMMGVSELPAHGQSLDQGIRKTVHIETKQYLNMGHKAAFDSRW